MAVPGILEFWLAGPHKEIPIILAAGAAIALEVLLLLILVTPSNGLLRDSQGELSPFFQRMVLIMAVGFLIPGLTYGLTVGPIKSDQDAAKMIEEPVRRMLEPTHFR